MTSHGKHSAVQKPLITRVFGARLAAMGVAAAATVGMVGLGAPVAQADSVWDRVAACESTGNWSINSGNGYYGGVQFGQPTWRDYGGKEFASFAHQATKGEQIAVAQRVLAGQGPGAWPTCSKRAGLTRSNGGADRNAEPGGSRADSSSASRSSTKVIRYVSARTSANVRSGPGVSYRTIGKEARGEIVRGTVSGGWLRISSSRYVSEVVLSRSSVSASRSSSSNSSSSSSTRKLAVDGIRGPDINRAIERFVGTTRNGSFDRTTIKALQRKVGTSADGKWGPKSQRSLQKFIGMSPDGSSYLNSRTVRALQSYFNSESIR